MIDFRNFALCGSFGLVATMAQAAGPADELTTILTDQCLPLVQEGIFAPATLSEVPSFVAANFFEMLGVEGAMYQLTPTGDARFVITEDQQLCVAYMQVEDIDSVLAGLEEWRIAAGFDGALPDPAQEGSDGLLSADGASIAVTWIANRAFLVLRVSDGG